MEDSETEIPAAKPSQEIRADSPSRKRSQSADFLSISDDGKPGNHRPSR